MNSRTQQLLKVDGEILPLWYIQLYFMWPAEAVGLNLDGGHVLCEKSPVLGWSEKTGSKILANIGFFYWRLSQVQCDSAPSNLQSSFSWTGCSSWWTRLLNGSDCSVIMAEWVNLWQLNGVYPREREKRVISGYMLYLYIHSSILLCVWNRRGQVGGGPCVYRHWHVRHDEPVWLGSLRLCTPPSLSALPSSLKLLSLSLSSCLTPSQHSVCFALFLATLPFPGSSGKCD